MPDILPRIWRYSLTLTGTADRADDLAQGAILKALEKAEQFEVGTRLDRWMFRIAHNLWVSDMRKNAVRAGGGLVAIEETDIISPDAGPEAAAMHREVLMAVLHLPEAQRVTVVLVYVEGYSYRDAAMILDIPLGTVMSRLATARATLGQKFREEGRARDAR
ncbi:RNA polymerase sigma factor [Roseobacter sp. YSTF-M11]|uniref:RNA polymerase sigma factor n=1 Tax=Roseobacter insulae TaxID=2859783 RepID=A0A9X1FTL7_9RHOB|nr:RNA polymerase sigma factor [Roseobacter insulae]